MWRKWLLPNSDLSVGRDCVSVRQRSSRRERVCASHPLVPDSELGLLASQFHTRSATCRIVPLTSSPCFASWTMIGLPASPPSLTWVTSGSLPWIDQPVDGRDDAWVCNVPNTSRCRSEAARSNLAGLPNSSRGVEQDPQVKCDILSKRPMIYGEGEDQLRC